MGVAYSDGHDSGLPIMDRNTCTACGDCVQICPVGCLTISTGQVQINPQQAFGCIACGHCAMVCPVEAIRVTGRRLPAQMPLVNFAGTPAAPEALEALMLSRRSIRRFTDQEVTRAQLDRILAAAAMAPMGFPPWEIGVVVFHGRDQVRELAHDAVSTYRKMVPFLDNAIARMLVRVFMGHVKFHAFYNMIVPLGKELAAAEDKGVDAACWNAPAALLFHSSPYADAVDATLACTYAMLEAHAMGLGTTIIGSVPGPLASRRDVLRKYGVPAGAQPRLVLIIGHPAVQFRRGIRRQFRGVSWWEQA